MSTTESRAKSLINDMLMRCAEEIERNMRRTIERQAEFYELTKQKTLSKMLGRYEDDYSLTQQFKYQETIGATLREMERTYLEYYGKPWDYVEPETPTATTATKKRGRPRKS